MGKNSVLIKVQVWNRLYIKNCVTRTEILLVSFLMYHITPGLLLSICRSLTAQEHQHPCPILLEFRHSSPPLCKNHKKHNVDKKIQICETVTLTESFVFSSCRCSKQSASRLLILNWSEHFIQWGCFQICRGNNKGRRKCIQHQKFSMLDEMLDEFRAFKI